MHSSSNSSRSSSSGNSRNVGSSSSSSSSAPRPESQRRITDIGRQYGYRPPAMSAYEYQRSRLLDLQQYYPHTRRRLDDQVAQREAQRRVVTDHDIIRQHYRFIREEEEEEEEEDNDDDSNELCDRHDSAREGADNFNHSSSAVQDGNSRADPLYQYGERLAKKYESKLYREYCLVDLSRADQLMIGMRWRTEREVLSRKGELVCAEMSCRMAEDDSTAQTRLGTYEVPFAYEEHGQQRSALVKLRLCSGCATKMRTVQHRKRRKKRRRVERDVRRGKRRDKDRRRYSQGSRSEDESEEEEEEEEVMG